MGNRTWPHPSSSTAFACTVSFICSRPTERVKRSSLLLLSSVLNPYFHAVLCLELADVRRVPICQPDAQIPNKQNPPQITRDAVEVYRYVDRTHQSSLAIPRSLQHRIRAFDLQASVAVGTPDGSKYSCSPRAIDTSLILGEFVAATIVHEREVPRTMERLRKPEKTRTCPSRLEPIPY
jgi:hypothetical protein